MISLSLVQLYIVELRVGVCFTNKWMVMKHKIISYDISQEDTVLT